MEEDDTLALSWYHGSASREEAEKALSLAGPGTFLLRDKTSSNGNQYVLSVSTRVGVQHFVIEKDGQGLYVFKSTNVSYKSLQAIIEQFKTSPLVSDQQSTLLEEPLTHCVEPESVHVTAERDQPEQLLDHQKHLWYHGSASRDEAEKALSMTECGTFTLRDKTSSNGNQYVLSVTTNVGVQHFVIEKTANGLYVFKSTNAYYNSVEEIIEHYKTTPLISHQQSTVLQEPLARCVEHEAVNLAAERKYVNVKTTHSPPEVLDLEETPAAKCTSLKTQPMKRYLLFVLATVGVIILLLSAILYVPLTICGTSWCKNGGICEDSTCVCKDGWKGKYCETDVNECELKTLVCAGKCKNTEGSYKCGCMSGFRLYTDGTSCYNDYVIEMIRVPQADEVLSESMHGMEFLIHQGNIMETREQKDYHNNKARRDVSENDAQALSFEHSNMINRTIHVTDCDMMLYYDYCLLTFQSKPPRCISLALFLETFLKKISIDLGGELPENLKKIKIEDAAIDICEELITFKAVYEDNIEIIPSFFSLQSISLGFTVFWPARVYELSISGNWIIGSLRFDINITKTSSGFNIDGFLFGSITIRDLTAALVDSFIPSKEAEDLFEQLDIGEVEFLNVTLSGTFTDFGYATSIGITTRIPSLGPLRLYLIVEKNYGASSTVVLAVALEALDLAPVIEHVTGHDISKVPIIGAIGFPNAGMVFANDRVSYTILQFRLDILDRLPYYNKGINLIFQTALLSSMSPIAFYLGIRQGHFRFRFIGTVKPIAEDILNLVLDTTGIELPTGFDPSMILTQTLEGLEYEKSTKALTFPVSLPERIPLIQGVLVLENAMAMFTISTQSMSSLSTRGGVAGVPDQPVSSTSVVFKAEGTWNITSINLVLKTKLTKLPTQGYMAEISSPVQLSAFDILAEFNFAVQSDLFLDLLQNIGLKNLKIGNPYIRVKLGSDYVVQASGRVAFGDLAGFQTEVLYSKLEGSAAFGVVTTFIKGLKSVGAESAMDMPGAGMLKASTFCIAASTHDISVVGNNDQFKRFYSSGLLAVTIKRGISLAILFTVPSECDNDFCKFTQNLLGVGASLVLQGTLSLEPFHFILFVAVSNAQIMILDGVYLTDVRLQLEYQTGRPSIGFACTIQLQNPYLILGGMIGISSNGLFVEFAAQGYFSLIPTVEVIEIGDIYFRAAIGPSPIAISYLACGAKIRLGLLNDENAVPIEAAAYFGLGVNSVNNFFLVKIRKFTIESALAAFNFHPNLPGFIAEIGFPEGVSISYSLSGMVLSTGDVIPAGFRLEGTIHVLWYRIRCLIHATPNFLLIDASITPLKIGRGLIKIGGRSDTEGPRLMVDFSWLPPRNPALLIEGKISILGIERLVNVTMNATGTSFYLEGNLWRLFYAHLFLRTSYASIRDAEFEIEAYMQQDLFHVLRESALEALDSYAKTADDAVTAAQGKIDSSRYLWNNAISKLERVREDLENGKQQFIAASNKLKSARKELDGAHASLDYAKSKLTSAQNKVRNQQRKFDDAKDELRRRRQKSCPSQPSKPKWYEAWKWPKYLAVSAAREACKAAFWLAERAVDAGKGLLNVATGALEAAKGVVEGARGAVYAAQGVLKAAEVLVGQSRHLITVAEEAIDGAIVIVDESQIVLDAAIKFLDGVKYVNRFGVKILEILVNVALGGIFEIEEIYFSAKLAALDKGHISAHIRISWLGQPARRYGFTLNFSSVQDMVKRLVDVIKGIIGLSRRKRDVSYDFFASVGPNTDKIFANLQEIVFDDCKKDIQTGINVVLEILHHLRKVSLDLQVQQNLTFFSRYQQDSLVVLDGPAMRELSALERGISHALNKTSHSKQMLQTQMQRASDSGMTDDMIDDMMQNMSSAMEHMASGMQSLQAMQQNDVNNYLRELEANMTRDNPQSHSSQTENDMNMVEQFISEIPVPAINQSFDIADQSYALYEELENINENDTEALRRISDRVNALKPMLVTIARHSEEMKISQNDMAQEMLAMDGMMSSNSTMIMSAVRRTAASQMSVNMTHQLMQYFNTDVNRSESEIEEMENSMLPAVNENPDEDEMMMHILENNLNSVQEEPMSPLESLGREMHAVSNAMAEIMGDMRNNMASRRSRRDASHMMRDMQRAMDEIDSMGTRLENSRDVVASVQRNLMDASGVLQNLEINEGVSTETIINSHHQLRNITASKSKVDDVIDDVIGIQVAGMLSWMEMLDGYIGISKNISLLQFVDLLEEGIVEHVKRNKQEALLDTLDLVRKVLAHVKDADADYDLTRALDKAIDLLEKQSTTSICEIKEHKRNTASSLSTGFGTSLIFLSLFLTK